MADYYYSEILGLPYKVDKESGVVTVKDYSTIGKYWVTYTPSEIDCISATGEISKRLHMVKKVFGGDILEVGK